MEHPGIAAASIHAAAILGDDVDAGRAPALDPTCATASGGPYNWDPLTHLCFSNYRTLSPECHEGLVRAATAPLDAGASIAGVQYPSGYDEVDALLQAHGAASS